MVSTTHGYEHANDNDLNAEARSRNSSDSGGVARSRSNTVEDESPRPEDTPSTWSWAPKSRTSVAFILASLIDSILLLAAIAFSVLDFAAITRKNEPIDSTFGRYIEEIEKWSATIYPIVFGALMSRSLKTIGRYFAERGIRLSNLCLMMNSSLMYDPMVNFIYAPISIFTVALFLIWACSPVGGQASLRLVHRQNITSTAQHEIRYQDTGPMGRKTLQEQIDFIATNAYMGSFTQAESTILGPVDNWGNIKIPRVDAFKENNIEPDNGWYDVKKLPRELEIWSGLYGLPVVGLAQYTNQRLKFSTQSVYIQPSCYNTTDHGLGGPLLGLNMSFAPLPPTETATDRAEKYSGDKDTDPSDTARILNVDSRD
ncbi:hypothetical protein AAP_06392 [Ascosphaera apis ARSEF 7405]|uniref:Uncharacterized protein n=1 Tax=Ascosphaera apis ARSEF 7405 TaxID=392613 RepID=A0A162HZI1_9EURO|nr:hypothetical protein AAP_06392 [Ascosphaera apis ARSEF 7405]